MTTEHLGTPLETRTMGEGIYGAIKDAQNRKKDTEMCSISLYFISIWASVFDTN